MIFVRGNENFVENIITLQVAVILTTINNLARSSV